MTCSHVDTHTHTHAHTHTHTHTHLNRVSLLPQLWPTDIPVPFCSLCVARLPPRLTRCRGNHRLRRPRHASYPPHTHTPPPRLFLTLILCIPVLFLGLGLTLNPVYSLLSALTLTLRVRVPRVNPSSCTPRPHTHVNRVSL